MRSIPPLTSGAIAPAAAAANQAAPLFRIRIDNEPEATLLQIRMCRILPYDLVSFLLLLRRLSFYP